MDWLVSQLREFSAFFGTKKSLYGTEENARLGITNMINGHIVLVAEREGQLLGFIAGVITPHMFNPNIRVLAETFWWVAEEHRGSRAGLMLLNEFMDYGTANCDWITFALEHHSPVDEKCLLRRGFHLQERSYLMEVC